MKKLKGFTLTELMVVVAIISILATVALPAYNDYVLRGKLTEATTQLAGTRVRLEQFYQDNRNYGSSAATCGLAMPASPDVQYFAYTCNWGAGGTDQFYTISASGVAAQGTGGFVYTIAQNNAKASTITAPGWTGNTTCWVTRKGGTC